MAEKELQEFFLEKKKKASSGNVDWQAKKNSWIQSIDDLYREITEQYLKASIGESVDVSYMTKQIAEDYIGEYTVRELVLQVGAEKVVFSPKGTNLVGASGRIDIRGDMGEVTIILQPDGWLVVERRTPALKLTPLNEQSLLTVLKNVMRR